MFELDKNSSPPLDEALVSSGYWVALADRYFQQKKYSKVVELCQPHMSDTFIPLSSRLIYAKALYYAGQIESAEIQFFKTLTCDPDNLVALKYLGDIKFGQKSEFEAMAFYWKIFTIDPYCRAVKSGIDTSSKRTTQTITLKRTEEAVQVVPVRKPLRKIPFYTETIGDLYLSQGFPRLAEEIFVELQKRKNSPRIAEKLSIAREKIKEKDTPHVKKTD